VGYYFKIQTTQNSYGRIVQKKVNLEMKFLLNSKS